jgi:hypothetical protein
MRDKSTAPLWLVEANREIEEDGFVIAIGILIISPEYNCSTPPPFLKRSDTFQLRPIVTDHALLFRIRNIFHRCFKRECSNNPCYSTEKV